MNDKNILAQIPQIDKILQKNEIQTLLENYPRDLLLDIIRTQIELYRKELLSKKSSDSAETQKVDESELINKICQAVKIYAPPKVRRCVNATGIVLHTGLGRAPLSRSAQIALNDASAGFCVVEYELESGKRGDRHQLVEDLLLKLTGAEAAAVVNNNAAATFLILNTFSFERESIVSRGELITIGGSFRIPDIMRRSGARMVEVGTTNRTILNDYEHAITENTALLLKIHTSNYRIVGFHEEASLPELVELGKKYQIPVVHDLGSGSLIDLSHYGLPKEPVVRDSIKFGADIVSFSGDKLLGGPQSGIIVGKKKYVDQIKANQLSRVLRCGKLTFAALEATLRLFLDEKKLVERHRVMQLLTQSPAVVKKRVVRLKKKLVPLIAQKGRVEIEQGVSEVGGGSLATESLPTFVVTLAIDGLHVEQLAQRLRLHNPPIISRIQTNKVVLDLFTVADDEIALIVQAVTAVINHSSYDKQFKR